MTLDPYNAFLHRGEQEGDWRVARQGRDRRRRACRRRRRRRSSTACPSATPSVSPRLRAAGAAIVGKLNTHEFAFGALTNSPHFGPARNPWDPSGRPAGRAAAAARPSPPASSTSRSAPTPPGRSGSRPRSAGSPATGRRSGSSRTRASSRSPGRSTRSARSARTAEECRRALEIMAGRVAADGAPGRRIGVVTRLFEEADPAVAAVCEEAVRALARRRRAGRAPAARRDRDDHAAGDAPRGGGRPPGLAPDAARRLRGRRPRTAARRAAAAVDGVPDRPARPELGCGRCGSASSAASTCSSAPAMPIVAPRLDAIPSGLPAADHAVQLAGRAARAPGHERALRLRRRAPGRPRARGPPRRGRPHARRAQAFQQATDWHERRPVDAASGEVLYTTDTADVEGGRPHVRADQGRAHRDRGRRLRRRHLRRERHRHADRPVARRRAPTR